MRCARRTGLHLAVSWTGLQTIVQIASAPVCPQPGPPVPASVRRARPNFVRWKFGLGGEFSLICQLVPKPCGILDGNELGNVGCNREMLAGVDASSSRSCQCRGDHQSRVVSAKGYRSHDGSCRHRRDACLIRNSALRQAHRRQLQLPPHRGAPG
jgi:hypothetical protein